MKTVSKVWDTYLRKHRNDFILLCSVSVVLIAAWELNYLGGESAKKSVTLYATIAGLSGTLLGFAITAITLLIGLFRADEFGPLRRNEDYGSLFYDYKLAIILLGITTLFALGATIAAAARVYSTIIVGLAIGLVGLSSLTMAHAARILWLAIKTHASAEQDF